MPKIPKKTTIKASAYFSPDTQEKLLKQSKQNYRSLNMEIIAAVEKALTEAEARESVGALS